MYELELIKRLETEARNKLIDSDTRTLFRNGADAIKSQAQIIGWYRDTARRIKEFLDK